MESPFRTGYVEEHYKTARALKILRQKQIKPSFYQSAFLPTGSAFFHSKAYKMEPFQLNYLQTSFTVSFEEKKKKFLEEYKCL